MAEPETCIVGLTYDATGQVSRLVWLRAPLVPGGEVATGSLVPDGRPISRAVFRRPDELAVPRGRRELHGRHALLPPAVRRRDRARAVRGREALAARVCQSAGPSPVRQIITGLLAAAGRGSSSKASSRASPTVGRSSPPLRSVPRARSPGTSRSTGQRVPGRRPARGGGVTRSAGRRRWATPLADRTELM